MKKTKDIKYLRISKNIEHKITNGVLKLGDKLPSLREICKNYSVSMSTAQEAYYALEGMGIIVSRPKSGYFVCFTPNSFPREIETTKPVEKFSSETESIISKVYSQIGTKGNILFSLGVPAADLLPVPKLNKALISAIHGLEGGGASLEALQGNSLLRRQIARGSYTWDGKLTEDDIITTSGCMNAITYCMSTLVSKGDTIAVESPVYFGVLQLAKSLGLNVIELPTNSVTGIEIDALKKAIENKKIKLCFLISNFSNPIGSCMPDDNKKEVVKLMEKHNIPLIEDDIYGDIYFGNQRPKSCKSFDESGIVLWCSSISKSLAPGYRVGWVAPGKFKDEILRVKLYQSVGATSITHEATGKFLEMGKYENHLRKLRHILHSNSLQYLRCINEYFPEDTKASRPQGGFLQWINLNKKIDTVRLFEDALKHKITIAPGRMYTLHNQYNNSVRLSFGMNWNDKVEGALKTLGKLCKQMI